MPSSVTIGNRIRVSVTVRSSVPIGIPNGATTSGANHAERGDPAEPEQEDPEQARGDRPCTATLSLDEQLAEHGHERRREGHVGDKRANQVRNLEGDRERVDVARDAEVVPSDDLADEPENTREAGGDAEDRRRVREAASLAERVRPGRRSRLDRLLSHEPITRRTG